MQYPPNLTPTEPRDAVTKLKRERAAYTSRRWKHWFTLHFEHLGVSARRLNAEASAVPTWDNAQAKLVTPEIGAQNVGTWIRSGTPVPKAEMAYRIGEGLRRCRPEDATASGPIAMHAAGYGQEVIQFLRALARTRAGARNAVVLYCVLPAINAKLDYCEESFPFGRIYRYEDAERNLVLGAKLVDKDDAIELDAEIDRLRQNRRREEYEYQEQLADKFLRYQEAFELMTHIEDVRPPRPTNLNQADAHASFLNVTVQALYKHCAPLEYAMCESWSYLFRWATNAHPFVFTRLKDALNPYFANLDPIDSTIEGLELVPVDEAFTDLTEGFPR